MPILRSYLTVLDLIIADLQQRLDDKEAEIARVTEEVDGLRVQVEDNGDVIKVKQR